MVGREILRGNLQKRAASFDRMKGSRSSSSSGVISSLGTAMKLEHEQSSKWGQTAEVLRWSQVAQGTKARRGKDLHGIRSEYGSGLNIGVDRQRSFWLAVKIAGVAEENY
ncbi:hypothetical protein NL676_014368 [Syzygium grande]|nr:hypothetical protein NL676_014368 [Syzygium grande]